MNLISYIEEAQLAGEILMPLSSWAESSRADSAFKVRDRPFGVVGCGREGQHPGGLTALFLSIVGVGPGWRTPDARAPAASFLVGKRSLQFTYIL